jgi:hypothetical protein
VFQESSANRWQFLWAAKGHKMADFDLRTAFNHYFSMVRVSFKRL